MKKKIYQGKFFIRRTQYSPSCIIFYTLYFFTKKLSINKAFIEVNDNKNLFGDKTCSRKGITKVFSLIKEKIENKMHKNWKNDLMGNNISEYGFPVL